MNRTLLLALALAIPGEPAPAYGPSRSASMADQLPALVREFEVHAGARLVFDAADLPPGRYHDHMPSLDVDGRLRAARTLVAEARKLPAGYLGAVGLRAVGVFRACVSRDGDGFRPYDAALGGYRYYGVWNRKDAVACAAYSEAQLGLTFHHEVFHHVDATRRGRTDAALLAQDPAFAQVQAGKAVYPALAVSPADLEALQRRARGHVLESAVGAYASKNPAEDKAETARYLMAHLADALVQMATRPQLAGSQRMLHVLARYEEAAPDAGPATAWFVAIALGRPADPPRPAAAAAKATPQEVLDALKRLNGGPLSAEKIAAARATLGRAADLDPPPDAGAAEAIVREAAALLPRLVRARIAPREGERAFTVHGREDASGINPMLRQDLAGFGRDAAHVKQLAHLTPRGVELASPSAREVLRLLARYYVFISSTWNVTPGTRQAFEKARDDILALLPPGVADALRKATALDLRSLATLPDDGAAAPAAANPYLKRVDEAVTASEVRAAIRRVQPACVRIGSASGVNVAPSGLVLTNAHVARRVGDQLLAQFPDGRSFKAVCTAVDGHLDLALCRLDSSEPLPFAPVAAAAPPASTRIVCVGNPGTQTPAGKATGYRPFHVSAGRIRGYLDVPLGNQGLGRLMHDAWTYWGHSGSPLFDETGHIVGLHNSWNPENAMRHGVPLQAIRHFLRREKVSEGE